MGKILISNEIKLIWIFQKALSYPDVIKDEIGDLS